MSFSISPESIRRKLTHFRFSLDNRSFNESHDPTIMIYYFAAQIICRFSLVRIFISWNNTTEAYGTVDLWAIREYISCAHSFSGTGTGTEWIGMADGRFVEDWRVLPLATDNWIEPETYAFRSVPWTNRRRKIVFCQRILYAHAHERRQTTIFKNENNAEPIFSTFWNSNNENGLERVSVVSGLSTEQERDRIWTPRSQHNSIMLHVSEK